VQCFSSIFQFGSISQLLVPLKSTAFRLIERQDALKLIISIERVRFSVDSRFQDFA